VVFDLLDKQTSTLKLLQQLYWQRRDPTEAEISRVENDVSTAQKQMHEALENLHKSQ
jgi:signal transduction histidine kinase